jgi:hypothetical protein
MKKILLLVGYKTINYGSALQTFATVKALEEYDFEVHTINLDNLWKKNQIRKLMYCLKNLEFVFLIGSRSRIAVAKIFQSIDKSYNSGYKKRKKEIQRFVNGELVFTKPISEYDQLRDILDNYYAVVLGSDQVWLPSNVMTDIYTLNFAWEHSIKKITYAPSIGVSVIKDRYLNKYKQMIESINYVSVREKSAQKLLGDITNKKIELVLDPVFLLTREKWNTYIPYKRTESEFFFVYFLSGDKKRRLLVKSFAERQALPIKAICHADTYVPIENRIYDMGEVGMSPENFVNNIREAKIIITDSFHCLAFALIEHKEVRIIPRHKNTKYSTNTRLYSLLECLGIDWIIIRTEKELEESMKRNIDYNLVDPIIETMKKDSHSFLKMALSD